MRKKDLILRNPLRIMRAENEDIFPEGGFGCVLARAGVGKTSLMVQFALNTLLRGKNVLHISLDDPVNKVCLWYEEIFRNITAQDEVAPIDELWEDILTHRFIMTFKVEGFSVPKLEERLTDLTEQGVFFPQMLIIDGLPFDNNVRSSLTGLKTLAENHGLHIWFTAVAHRDDTSTPEGVPASFESLSTFFDVLLRLQTHGNEVHVQALKGANTNEKPSLLLDPSTMLIKKSA